MVARSLYDVLIIGGGPAGLSAALGLSRQLYTTVIFDSRKYRQDCTQHMHNVLGSDHATPTDFRAKAEANILNRYDTVQFKNVEISNVQKLSNGSGFEAHDANGDVYIGRKLILASGVQDMSPLIDGWEDCWGKTCFHCLFCHGYEDRGASAGVLATGMLAAPRMALHVARMAKRLAKHVTLYTNADRKVSDQLCETLHEKWLGVDDRKIVRMQHNQFNYENPGSNDENMTIHFEDGSTKNEAFLAHLPDTRIRGVFAEQLGCEIEQGSQQFIKTTPPFYETSVPGVFAVGDVGTMYKSVVQAMQMGSFAAVGIVASLGAEETQH